MKTYVILLTLVSCISALLEDECILRVETSKNIGTSCSKQLEILCRRHDILFTLWDASSKIIRTGLTAASERDLGNFDLCMEVDTRIEDTHILGKFCPNQWLTLVQKEELWNHVPVMQMSDKTSKKKYMDDMAKNITIIGSLCIPDSCSPEEFNEIFKFYSYSLTFLNQFDCLTKYTRRQLTTFELIVTLILALVVMTMISCTIIHAVYYYTKTEKPHDLVEGFSALSNGIKLFSISTDEVNQIQCMNGLRFISMLWIVAFHGFLTAQAKPFVNAKDAVEWKSQLYAQYIQSGYIAVDTFFFLSGFLLAYGYLKQVENQSTLQQIKRFPSMLLYRYLRLTPVVGALFLVSISFFKLLGDGPMWFTYHDVIQVPCSKNWWRFFSYTQTYYSDDLCYTHTWYLSADMQMFIFAPLVLIPASRYVKKKTNYVITGLIILIGLFVGITLILPYSIEDFSDNYDTHSRVSGYLVGVLGGVIFHKNRGKRIKINGVINIILWSATLGVMLFLVFCNYYVTVYNPSKLNYTLFCAFYRPMWCTCILWIVFSCYHGYGGFINWFLSNILFQLGAKLSYCMYVLHGTIMFLSLGSMRTNSYFGDYEMINVVSGYVNITFLLAIFWTLTFEAPMAMLNKKISGWIGSTKAHKPKRK